MSLIIRELHIKTTVRYHLTPVRMAIINKSTTIFVRMQRKGNLHALLVGMQPDEATVENSMEFPQNIKNGTALWPSNSTSGNLSEETWNTKSKNISTPMFITTLFIIYNSQNLEAAQTPISRWGDKEAVILLSSSIHAVAKGKIFFFLWLSSIPLYKCLTVALSTHLLMDSWDVSISWLLQITLQWT